ncbi:MAG: cell division protein SepF [Actinomycetaceae bacterium]|nr:cell division protein SepF [Actinomycetaceae bacterium]
MSGALNRAMEKIGWRGYEGDVEEEYYEEEPFEEFEPVTPMPRPEIVSTPVHEPDMSRIVTVHPTSYDDARTIGESFRDGIPVIINLSNMREEEARRIIDFSAGLAFGLHGTIESVTNRVLLLSPESIKVEEGKETRSTVGGSFF